MVRFIRLGDIRGNSIQRKTRKSDKSVSYNSKIISFIAQLKLCTCFKINFRPQFSFPLTQKWFLIIKFKVYSFIFNFLKLNLSHRYSSFVHINSYFYRNDLGINQRREIAVCIQIKILKRNIFFNVYCFDIQTSNQHLKSQTSWVTL